MSTDATQTTVEFFNRLAEALAGEDVSCNECDAIATYQNGISLLLPVIHTIKVSVEDLMFGHLNDRPVIPRSREEFLQITYLEPLSTLWDGRNESMISQFSEFYTLRGITQQSRDRRAFSYLNKHWAFGELAQGKLTLDKGLEIEDDNADYVAISVGGIIHARGDSDKPNSTDRKLFDTIVSELTHLNEAAKYAVIEASYTNSTYVKSLLVQMDRKAAEQENGY